jgi:hypothetical protein
LLWGWRVPFLSAFPIVIVALVLRGHMAESQGFLAAHACDGEAPAPTPPVCSGEAASGLLRRMPVAQLLRQRPLGFLADCVYVAWLSSGGWVGLAMGETGDMAAARAGRGRFGGSC